MFPCSPRRLWRAGALGLVLLAAAPSSVASAHDCVDSTAAFSPGTWTAGGLSFTHDISDGFAAGVIEGEAGFTLVVDDLGQVSGNYTAVFSGSLEALSEETSGDATIVITGDLSGTAADVQVDGESSFEIGSSIDVSGSDGVDVFAGHGVSFEHTSNFTQPFTTQIRPSLANCGEAIGNLSQDPERQILFIATRSTGNAATDAQIADQVVEFLGRAQDTFADPLVETGSLHDLIREGEEVDALVAAQGYCGADQLGSLAAGGSAHDLYRSSLLQLLFQFVDRARAGEFSTPDVIRALSAATRGASFGGEAGECVGPEDGTFGVLRRNFEEVLLGRLQAAADRADTAEIQALRVASLQFGMTTIIEQTGGYPS